MADNDNFDADKKDDKEEKSQSLLTEALLQRTGCCLAFVSIIVCMLAVLLGD